MTGKRGVNRKRDVPSPYGAQGDKDPLCVGAENCAFAKQRGRCGLRRTNLSESTIENMKCSEAVELCSRKWTPE